MSLRLNGSTSGYVEIDAPAVAGTTSITIPATAGELAVKATDGSVDLGGVNVDADGRLLVGTSSARTNFFNSNYGGIFQVETANNETGRVSTFTAGSSGGGGPIIALGKHRSNTVGDNTLVANGDEAGLISFQGADGTEFVECARISAFVDGTPGANDMPGRLVFSTTADGSSSPTERLTIKNTGAVNCFTGNDGNFNVRTSITSGTLGVLLVRNGATNTTDGTTRFAVMGDGDVENTNNSYGPLSSDERLKQDITDANSQWDDIKNIRITNFHFKNDPAGPLQLGPIAQELEQVSPGLITRRPASEEEIADPSNSLVDGDEVLSFKASILYMKAVKALQEAMERIETLEAANASQAATIAALEARITTLEANP